MAPIISLPLMYKADDHCEGQATPDKSNGTHTLF